MLIKRTLPNSIPGCIIFRPIWTYSKETPLPSCCWTSHKRRLKMCCRNESSKSCCPQGTHPISIATLTCQEQNVNTAIICRCNNISLAKKDGIQFRLLLKLAILDASERKTYLISIFFFFFIKATRKFDSLANTTAGCHFHPVPCVIWFGIYPSNVMRFLSSSPPLWTRKPAHRHNVMTISIVI